MPVATGPNDTRIHYERHDGDGPAVVLLQGLSLSGRFWFDMPARLQQRSRRYRVLVPDNRGTGRSDKPRGRYRMADMADDVAAVLDHAGEKDAIVVGISLGGMIAQNVALRHPSRVRGLVLMATTPGLPHGRLPPLGSLKSLVALPFAKPGQMSKGALSILIPEREHGRVDELFAGWPELMRSERAPRHAFFGQLSAAATHSTGHRLAHIRCSTVVVTGEEDILIPPRNSRFLAAGIPRARLWRLPGVGHAIPTLDREVVARAVDAVAEDA